MYPFTLPDPIAFLELVQKLKFPDYNLRQQEDFRKIWDYIFQWLELKQPDELKQARPIIWNIARRLKDNPRLLYGLNTILWPYYRIECLTTQPAVTYYVLVAGGHCEIHTTSSFSPVSAGTSESLQGLLDQKDRWEETVNAITENERLVCIAQILQEITENPLGSDACRQSARKRLYRFGKMGILPPSNFIHFVTPPPDYESCIEHSESGGFCDAHKITVNKISLCFRVIRQWQTSDSVKINQQFCRELSVWRQLNHPNILPLIGATTEAFPRRYCFIVHWLANGSIMSYLGINPTHDKYLAISQIVDGVNYLHGLDPPVSHKDLKGENVLVRSDLVCVITDFGLSGALDTQRSRTTAAMGTMSWMPPELFFVEDDDENLPSDARPRDVYSLGCTIAQILTSKTPKFIMLSVITGKQPTLPPSKDAGWHEDELHLWDLVQKCIAVDPEQRPLIPGVKKHLEVARQSEPSHFELPQSRHRKVDRRHLIDWIESQSLTIGHKYRPYDPFLPPFSNAPASRTMPQKKKNNPTPSAYSLVSGMWPPSRNPYEPILENIASSKSLFSSNPYSLGGGHQLYDYPQPVLYPRQSPARTTFTQAVQSPAPDTARNEPLSSSRIPPSNFRGYHHSSLTQPSTHSNQFHTPPPASGIAAPDINRKSTQQSRSTPRSSRHAVSPSSSVLPPGSHKDVEVEDWLVVEKDPRTRDQCYLGDSDRR